MIYIIFLLQNNVQPICFSISQNFITNFYIFKLISTFFQFFYDIDIFVELDLRYFNPWK